MNPSKFVCECEEHMRPVCGGEPEYSDHEGKRYCVLHFPTGKSKKTFDQAVKRKTDARDYNFRGVWFPNEVRFDDVDAQADFSYATFNGEADFGSTKFYQIAAFTKAIFKGSAYFAEAEFHNEAAFLFSTFESEADFSDAKFKGVADFSETKFIAKANFAATFSGGVDFSGSLFSSRANFEEAVFDIPNASLIDPILDFSRAKFNGQVSFSSVRFENRSNVPENLDFSDARFAEEVDFTSAAFGARTSFRRAVFGAEADFSPKKRVEEGGSPAYFKQDADFSETTFGGKANFADAVFIRDASFSDATFAGEANFSHAEFKLNLDLSEATFRDYLRFASKKPDALLAESLDFQYARIDIPDHVSFHTLKLYPHWFISVDARKFDFTNVRWLGTLPEEIETLITRQVSSPHRLLSIAYRQLALNAEENHRYDEASQFRYQTMAARRRERWHDFAAWRSWLRWLSDRWNRISRHRIILFLRRDRLHWFYWILSGYGERVFRGFVALAGIWLVFAWLYTCVGFVRWVPPATIGLEVVGPRYDEVGEPLRFTRALSYSLGVMSLQKPEPRPLTNWAHTLVTVETILGPVQAALLLLAIRRKFMR